MKQKMRVRVATGVALAMATAVGAVVLGVTGFTASAADPTSVTVNGQTRSLNGVNIYRSTNYLVMYTPLGRTTTGTNEYGYEAAVVNGVVTQVANSVGNMTIPTNGYVLSGHGTSRTWLIANAKVGATVTLDGQTILAAPVVVLTAHVTAPDDPAAWWDREYPDVGVRTLRQFTIVNTGGRKLLKFPVVTANIGTGALEVKATRSSSTSSDWVGNQVVYNTNGTTTSLPTGLQFYWAGDGHNHWHMLDFDGYDLFDPSGHKLREGEKHGYCFEDNTGYRDWPSTGKNGTPSSPVYTHAASCGQSQPGATTITHGLSVGWGDTYPSSLPDQAIDVTGLADGNYRVIITADQFGGIRESNENNNTASALVKITGNTVTLVSATDGL